MPKCEGVSASFAPIMSRTPQRKTNSLYHSLLAKTGAGRQANSLVQPGVALSKGENGSSAAKRSMYLLSSSELRPEKQAQSAPPLLLLKMMQSAAAATILP